jgi:hypothetical protein
MKCVRVSHTINQYGVVQSIIDLDDNTFINIPYSGSNIFLEGKDIESPNDAVPVFTSPIQYCPCCGTMLHIRSNESVCYNIHCNRLKYEIFAHHLSIFGYNFNTVDASIKLCVLGSLTHDVAYPFGYNFLDYTSKYLSLAEATTVIHNLKHTSIQTFLSMCRIFEQPTCYDHAYIQDRYPTVLEFIHAVFDGSFMTATYPSISQDIKNAINLSLGYINRDFVIKILQVIS